MIYLILYGVPWCVYGRGNHKISDNNHENYFETIHWLKAAKHLLALFGACRALGCWASSLVIVCIFPGFIQWFELHSKQQHANEKAMSRRVHQPQQRKRSASSSSRSSVPSLTNRTYSSTATLESSSMKTVSRRARRQRLQHQQYMQQQRSKQQQPWTIDLQHQRDAKKWKSQRRYKEKQQQLDAAMAAAVANNHSNNGRRRRISKPGAQWAKLTAAIRNRHHRSVSASSCVELYWWMDDLIDHWIERSS